MLEWLLAGATACLIAQESAGLDRIPTGKELEEAWASFENALPALQATVVAEIAARIDASVEPDLKPLLALRDRAVRELEIVPARPREFHDAAKYGVRITRAAVDPASADAAEKRDLFKPWESALPIRARIAWNLARDAAEDAGAPLPPLQQLENFLNGYPPGSDVLIAWIEKQFDFDPSLDSRLDHFDHLYCDLNGVAYPEVTLYDAFASRSTMDMPDVEVIAYARNVLGDDSYVAPIPPDSRRQRLYDAVSDGFLASFRYRVWIEAAANLYVRPTAPLRATHEGLRSRLLQLFAVEGGDVARIAERLASFKSRDPFINAMDADLERDPGLSTKADQFAAQRAGQAWTVARAAYAVLRERRFLDR